MAGALVSLALAALVVLRPRRETLLAVLALACAYAHLGIRHRSRPGVPPREWEQMFAPYQRLDDRGGGTSAGVGLGLAIARGFTEATGGTLAPLVTDGGGLTMTVSLPPAPLAQPMPVGGTGPVGS